VQRIPREQIRATISAEGLLPEPPGRQGAQAGELN
jgi:hypothetical protein